MSFGNMLSAVDVSASGLSAERLRMEIVANNIANANSTRTQSGEAYRRQQVVFSAAYDEALNKGVEGNNLSGVKVVGVQSDMTELPRVFQPGHPDADADGYVTMPNVTIPTEMVDLITASRGYEANLKVLRSFREMAERALSILRGNS